jgi:hypothetical protein
MALFPLGILSAAGAGEATRTYELIETQILASNQGSVIFTGLATYSSTYKHLQVRVVARSANGGTNTINVWSRLNGDSGANYSWHQIAGSAGTSGTSTTWFASGVVLENGATANVFPASTIDLLDCYSTSKNKTARSLTGAGSTVRFLSGSWRNTASVTSWELLPNTGNFLSGSRFSIYGLKG